MGNYRFRLSDMMPNAWFHKLKDMGTPRNHTTSSTPTHSFKKKQPTTAPSVIAASAARPQPSKSNQPHRQFSYPRKSYYFPREFIPTNPISSDSHFHDPPRRSSKHRQLKRTTILNSSSPKVVSSTVSTGCSSRSTIWNKSSDYSASSSYTSPELDPSDSFPSEFRSDRVLETQSSDSAAARSSPCGCNIDSNADDIIINVDKKSLGIKFDKLDLSDLNLPPIVTRPAKLDEKVEDIKRKKEHRSSSLRRHSLNSSRLRLRVNSPRIANRRIQAHARKSVSSTSSSSCRRTLSDSRAIVKSSFDPQKDFRDSMVEMIVENDIRASKDLEDLLACYLSLNSDEYHDLIIKVFKQIWFDLTGTRSK